MQEELSKVRDQMDTMARKHSDTTARMEHKVGGAQVFHFGSGKYR